MARTTPDHLTGLAHRATHAHARVATAAGHRSRRHARAASRGRRAEPVRWAVSGAARGWQWVWSVDHDDQVALAVAKVAQFAMLAAMFFALVLAGA
jgi:hypothetical protein